MGSRQSRWALAALVLFQVLTAGGVAADGRSRPFSVVIDGNANPVFSGCTVLNTETGTGHATHMGTITWQSTETVDACSDPEFAQVDGQFVLTDHFSGRIAF